MVLGVNRRHLPILYLIITELQLSLELPDPAELTRVPVDQLPLIMRQLVKGCPNRVLRTDPERLLELQGETIERLLARLLAGRFPEADHPSLTYSVDLYSPRKIQS